MNIEFSWKTFFGLIFTSIVAGVFIVLVAAAIQKFVPPNTHKTCSVFYQFNEFTTYGSEWKILDTETCGNIYIDSEFLDIQ